jgi:hypothetical protein
MGIRSKLLHAVLIPGRTMHSPKLARSTLHPPLPTRHFQYLWTFSTTTNDSCCHDSNNEVTNNQSAAADAQLLQQQQHQQHQQQHSLADFDYTKSRYIPPPSWSISDLELTSQQPPLPKEELDRLSRLALIDMDRYKNQNENDQEPLNQDLANMLHMIKQVTDFTTCNNKNNDNNKNNNNGELSSIDDDDDHGHDVSDVDTDVTGSSSDQIYDVVRGVSAAPLRKMSSKDPLHKQDETQAKNVWDNLLEYKTVRKGGGHQYFAIIVSDSTAQQPSQPSPQD